MKNLDGCGNRAIITGEKGKGDAELFNLLVLEQFKIGEIYCTLRLIFLLLINKKPISI